jgi:hypothetical protein
LWIEAALLLCLLSSSYTTPAILVLVSGEILASFSTADSVGDIMGAVKYSVDLEI